MPFVAAHPTTTRMSVTMDGSPITLDMVATDEIGEVVIEVKAVVPHPRNGTVWAMRHRHPLNFPFDLATADLWTGYAVGIHPECEWRHIQTPTVESLLEVLQPVLDAAAEGVNEWANHPITSIDAQLARVSLAFIDADAAARAADEAAKAAHQHMLQMMGEMDQLEADRRRAVAEECY